MKGWGPASHTVTLFHRWSCFVGFFFFTLNHLHGSKVCTLLLISSVSSSFARCFGEDSCLSIPDIKAVVMVLPPSEPKITITGSNRLVRPAGDLRGPLGVAPFKELRITSTVMKGDGLGRREWRVACAVNTSRVVRHTHTRKAATVTLSLQTACSPAAWRDRGDAQPGLLRRAGDRRGAQPREGESGDSPQCSGGKTPGRHQLHLWDLYIR